MKTIIITLFMLLFSLVTLGQNYTQTQVADTYDYINEMTWIEERKDYFRQLDHEMKYKLWNEHFTRKKVEWGSSLQSGQVTAINNLIAANSSTVSENAMNNVATPTFSAALNALKLSLADNPGQFSELVFVLGNVSTLDDGVAELNSIVPVYFDELGRLIPRDRTPLPPARRGCVCATASLCSGASCHYVICVQSDTGCGCLWYYRCDGALGDPPGY